MVTAKKRVADAEHAQAERQREGPPHPAPFWTGFLSHFATLLRNHRNVLDPMAGIGRLVEIRNYGYTGDIYLNELEPEWATQAPPGATRITIGDARHLPYPDGFFSAICTSPTYGNRMADHHRARDKSHRITYTHYLGRPLSPGNTGAMQWGEKYRRVHREIWTECWRVLEPGGILILNISDHYRKGKIIPVTAWHRSVLEELGFRLIREDRFKTPRRRFGANYKLRAEYESVLVFEKPDEKREG